MAERNLVYLVISGSRMYGTYNKDSDYDYRGIFVPDSDYVVGMHKCDQVIFEKHHPNFSGKVLDYTIYSLPKFFKLAIDNNPNIVELLFAPEESIKGRSEISSIIINNRDLFISQKSYYTFTGYAYSQKHKIINKGKDNVSGKRKFLYDKYGWDTKSGSHLIRVLIQIKQLLIMGKIMFPLEESPLLLDIRDGKYTQKEVLEMSDTMLSDVDKYFDKTILPYSADIKSLNELQQEILFDYWKKT